MEIDRDINAYPVMQRQVEAEIENSHFKAMKPNLPLRVHTEHKSSVYSVIDLDQYLSPQKPKVNDTGFGKFRKTLDEDRNELEQVNRSLQNISYRPPYYDEPQSAFSKKNHSFVADDRNQLRSSLNQVDFNQTDPLPIYHMFFQNVEMMRRSGRSLLEVSLPPNPLTASKLSFSKKLPVIKSSNPQPKTTKYAEEEESNAGDTSIRDLIDEGIRDIYEDPEIHQDNFLHALYEPAVHMSKREQPVMEEINNMNYLEAPIDDFPFNDYVNLSAFPVYAHNPFLLYLKASSLFSNSMLFENQFIKIVCKTEKVLYEEGSEICMRLFYQANMPGVVISAGLIDGDGVVSEPPIIEHHLLSPEIEQTFVLQNINTLKLIDLPTLEVQMFVRGQAYVFHIPLPFSVNKYFQPFPVGLDDAIKYLDGVR